jgi:hypothetical protein
MGKHVIGIIIVIVAGISLVSVLAFTALKDVVKEAPFARKFNASHLRIKNAMSKNGEITGIAGATQNFIFFKTNDPSKVVKTSYELDGKMYINTGFIKNSRIASRFDIMIDSPVISLLAGNVPAIMTGTLNGAVNTYRFPKAVFSRATQISPSSYVFRIFDKSLGSTEQIFQRGNPRTGEQKNENNISERNNDAGISTDGLLHYDSLNNIVVYVFFYKNEFLCLDTNLNIINKEVTLNSIKTKSVKAEGLSLNHNKLITYTNTGPRKLINGSSYIVNGLLLINSMIKSKNQNEIEFTKSSTVDVYDLKTNNYLESFYIPPYQGEKTYQFKIFHNTLIANYKSYIVTYAINSANLSAANKEESSMKTSPKQ